MIEPNLNGTLLLTSSLLDQKISAKHPPPPSWASAKSRRSQSNDDVYNSESVSVYHVITYPASIITTLTSCLHHQFLGLAWYGQYIQWTPLFCIRNSLARSLQPFLPHFFPRNAGVLIFLSVWWTRRMFTAWRGLTRLCEIWTFIKIKYQGNC